MIPYFYEKHGNAASRSHQFGWEAEDAVDYAREQIAKLLDVEDKEISSLLARPKATTWPSKGCLKCMPKKATTSSPPKPSTKPSWIPANTWKKQGAEITYLKVKEDGLVDLADLEAAIKPNTILVSLMWANNETGVIQPMREIAMICEKHGVLFPLGCYAGRGQNPDPPTRNRGSPHVVHRPQNVRPERRRRTVRESQKPKGESDRPNGRRRPRTRHAFRYAQRAWYRWFWQSRRNRSPRNGAGYRSLSKLRDHLQAELTKLEETKVNGNEQSRMPHVTNISFKHVEGEGLMMTFNQNIAVSSGSACTSASLEPSYVLVGMGLGDDLAHSSHSFLAGPFHYRRRSGFQAIELVRNGVNHMRELSPHLGNVPGRRGPDQN
jgi:cysteine desulfurase